MSDAAATRAQAELDRVTRERDDYAVLLDAVNGDGKLSIPDELRRLVAAQQVQIKQMLDNLAALEAELERVTRERDEACSEVESVKAAFFERCEVIGRQLEQKMQLSNALAALQSRNAALEAELAQARERERRLRETDIEDLPLAYNGDTTTYAAGWNHANEEWRTALAGGKEGA